MRFFIELEWNWRWWEVCLGVNLGDYDEWFLTAAFGPVCVTAGWRRPTTWQDFAAWASLRHSRRLYSFLDD